MKQGLQRSFLFVPATRPERIPKALASGADAVIVDLEDAVAHDKKDEARQALQEFLEQTPDARVMVRVNSTSRELKQDLALCTNFPGVVGVMLPKTETCHQIEQVRTCNKPVWPLIETARGLLALPSLVFTAGIERLCFGALDMATELNLTPGTNGASKILDQCRYQLVVCSRSAGLAPPIESVVPEIDDLTAVERTATHAAEMGFTGMLSIHPRQLPAIHQAFTPSEEALAWARRVLEGAETLGGAFQLDGQMIDAPVISRARALLARAGH
ncbi:HpcH/HpaI aldolase/citrate lyase family protein [Billgrantia endophytica]|uniref:CoA ester lyase n=1 Tax=Billgrantia endophytica TaxID=2033802 RepID=A0A2N7TZU5_9GAMM|nr:CoA ester lyase [Halomonas endophytica]PMR73683.1 CoA ester lyase [Halomonas endophytica]